MKDQQKTEQIKNAFPLETSLMQPYFALSVLRNIYTQNELFVVPKQQISKEFELFLVENEQRFNRCKGTAATAVAAALMDKHGRHTDTAALTGLQTQMDSILETNKVAHDETRAEVRAAARASEAVLRKANFKRLNLTAANLPPLSLAATATAAAPVVLRESFHFS